MFTARPFAVGLDVDGHTRAALARTPGKGLSARARPENLLTNTGNNKTRGKNSKQTPFRSNILQTKTVSDDGGVKPVTTTVTAPSRPLLDKTPFPNRTRDANAFHTPLPTTKLAFLDPAVLADDGSPLLFPRPSSTRKHIRVPRSASRSFETPPNRSANPWDVSELDICFTTQQEEPSCVLSDPVMAEDYDEVEYVPPRLIDPPYCPPMDFELPDYKELGARLLELARAYPIDDGAPSPLDHEYEGEFLTSPSQWSVPLQDLDSDMDSVSKNRGVSRTKATVTKTNRPVEAQQRARGQVGSAQQRHTRIPMSSRASSQSRAGAGSIARPMTSAGVPAKRNPPVRGVGSGARTTPAAGTAMPAKQKTGVVGQRGVGVSARRAGPRAEKGEGKALSKKSDTVKGDDEVLLNVVGEGTVGGVDDFLFSV